jgi:hypothetical protein
MMTLMITYAPESESFITVMQVVSGAGALAACALAIWLSWLPRDHWIRRSKPISTVLVAASVTVSLVFLLVG